MRQIEQILLSGKENAYLYIKVYTVFLEKSRNFL